MIGVKLEGRLGNQLFQYAFALNLARKTGQSFYIDQEKYAFYGRKYFELKSFNKVKNMVNQEIAQGFLKLHANLEDQWISPADNLSQFHMNNSLFFGYFQSEEYFIEYRELIKREFRLKNKVKIDAQKLFGIHGKYVAIHIRRADYLNFGDDSLGGKNLVLPISYYLNALESVCSIDNYQIVVVSDEIETVKKELILKNAIYSSSIEMIIDFQIIQQANVAIIANSSFSWWAAYLGENNIVIAPKYWLGFKVNKEYPKNIIPPFWIVR